MNSQKLLALCLIVFCQLAAAQQDNIWYFGYSAGLSFATGEPVALTNGQTQCFEGTSVLSSPDGSLLFYTEIIRSEKLVTITCVYNLKGVARIQWEWGHR